MYNTLEDARLYLEKEVDLLDSIYDNFQVAKSSPSNMLQYLKQFEKIVEGVKANKIKVSNFEEICSSTMAAFMLCTTTAN